MHWTVALDICQGDVSQWSTRERACTPHMEFTAHQPVSTTTTTTTTKTKNSHIRDISLMDDWNVSTVNAQWWKSRGVQNFYMEKQTHTKRSQFIYVWVAHGLWPNKVNPAFNVFWHVPHKRGRRKNCTIRVYGACALCTKVWRNRGNLRVPRFGSRLSCSPAAVPRDVLLPHTFPYRIWSHNLSRIHFLNKSYE